MKRGDQSNDADALCRALAGALERPLDDRQAGAVALWLERLVEWNARIDLTAARGLREVTELMLADALVLAEGIEEGARVVDVGTGAGAPGLALALLRPDLAMTLVEPLTKRVSFLRTVLGEAGRSDVEIVRARAETLTDAPRWDVAVSRATLAPPAWARLGLSLAPCAWVMLAREAPPVVEEASSDRSVEYTLPWSGNARTLVRYTRTG